MAAAEVHQSQPLNSEPSDPEVRAKQDLPPKSYAAALEDNTPQENGDSKALEPANDRQTKTKSSKSKSKPNGSMRRDHEANMDDIVQEKFRTTNGSKDKLTSIKPSEDYEAGLRQDRKERRHGKESQLVSGRTAAAGWESSSIRWAPLNVPLKRRLQTVAVLAHSLTMPLCLTLFFWLCAIPLLWPILLAYMVFLLLSNGGSDGTLRLRREGLRGSKFWSLFASYFPARLHRTEELPPTRKYVFGYHPHGIISHGAFAAFATEALGFGQLFPGITNTLLTLDSNFRLPLYRDYALRLGLASVSRESCENLLNKGGANGEGMGRAITIVVGGASESLLATPGQVSLVLGRRKGFVKLGIRTGADLVPVMAFGENDIYDQVSREHHPWIHRFQLIFKKIMGFTIPLFHARGIFNYDVGLMPYRRPINIVVGKPIMVQQQAKPDPAYVEEIHDRYVQELTNIWDEWKDEFAKERVSELEVLE